VVETPATTAGVVSLPILQASAAAKASARAATEVNFKRTRMGLEAAGRAGYLLDAQSGKFCTRKRRNENISVSPRWLQVVYARNLGDLPAKSQRREGRN
jgi:hypothetical protein